MISKISDRQPCGDSAKALIEGSEFSQNLHLICVSEERANTDGVKVLDNIGFKT
jgi:hypothetical protein